MPRPATIYDVFGLLLVLLLSACCVAETIKDPAAQVAQAYRKHSKETARLDALANTSCSDAILTKAQYTSFAHGLKISWDAKAKAYKMQLHDASATVAFSMPQQALTGNSKIHPGTYYLSTPQLVRNTLTCGASALGEGTFVVRAQPGTKGVPPDSAAVTRFQAYQMQSSECGDEITIWGWLLGQKPRTPAEVSRLSSFYRTKPTILSLPRGMDITLILDGSLNATNATSDRDSVALPPSCYPNTTFTRAQSAASLRRAQAAFSDCSEAFAGGPKQAIETGAAIAIDVLSMVPILGEFVSHMNTVFSYLQPSAVISGKSVYDCISGFVEAAIDKKIGEYDLRRISQQLAFIRREYDTFAKAINSSRKPTPSDTDQYTIKSSFDNVIQETDRMASIYLDSPGPVSPGGALPAFTTFVSTQYLPLLKFKYDSYTQIYGGTAEEVSRQRNDVLTASKAALAASEAFFANTSAAMVIARASKVTELTYFGNCPFTCTDCPSYCLYGYSFTDEITGQVYSTSESDDVYNYDGPFKTYASALRRLVVNRVESAERINIYQSTASRPLWPLLVAGGGGGKVLKQHVVVEKNLCFSNWVDCDDRNGNSIMPVGHNYQDYNISDIHIQQGNWVDFIRVTYTHRTTGQKLTQEFGNPNGGSVPRSGPLRNLLTDPVTKATWWNEALGEMDVSIMTGLELTQASGTMVNAGLPDKKSFVDDFSLWKGNVYLCGMHIHGEKARVHGIAPHWCYSEAYTA